MAEDAPPPLGSRSRPSQNDAELLAYMEMGDEYLGAIGYTEHGMRHANLIAHIAGNILRRLGYDERDAELGAIAGFMHDIGNCVCARDARDLLGAAREGRPVRGSGWTRARSHAS